jgi:small multidrug resistance family-3 protein
VPEVARALALFVLAGLAEIGGGWLVWQFLRESRPWPFGLLGSLVLISYGVIVTFQADPHFGRVYAAYGGIFMVMALTCRSRCDSRTRC